MVGVFVAIIFEDWSREEIKGPEGGGCRMNDPPCIREL